MVTGPPDPEGTTFEADAPPGPRTRRALLSLPKRTVEAFLADGGPRLAAALAFYAVLCLPAIVVLATLIAGFFVEQETVRAAIGGQLGGVIGSGAAQLIVDMLRDAERPGATGGIAAGLGTLALLVGAAGAFSQLQAALNAAWGVAPERWGMGRFVRKRLASFVMLLATGLLLLVSLLISALLVKVEAMAAGFVPELPGRVALPLLNAAFWLVMTIVLFAAILRVIPDTEIAWADVWVGAGLTGLLFTSGKFLIGLYLGRSHHVSAWGAAGSLVLVLLWVYYSAWIVLLGAEFTQLWARRRRGREADDGVFA